MPEAWRVVSSRMRHEDEWLRVRSDRCVAADGHVIDPFYVLEYPDWINVVALTADAEIVLVREYRHGAGRVLTGLIAGHVGANEPPAAAAERELREETGYRGTLHELGSYWANPAMQTNRVWSYLAAGVERVTDTELDPNEDIEVVRRPFLSFLRDWRAGAEDMQGLHLAGLYLAVPYILRHELPGLSDLRAELRADFLG